MSSPRPAASRSPPAAEGLSQPTLSAQVRALEAGYGVGLFDRQGRGVRMTPAGQSLYAVTTRLFAAEEEARALLTGGRALTRGHLRVSADSAYHVMPILAALKQRHEGLTFSLKIDNSAARARSIDRPWRRHRGHGQDDVRSAHLFDEAARRSARAVRAAGASMGAPAAAADRRSRRPRHRYSRARIDHP